MSELNDLTPEQEKLLKTHMRRIRVLFYFGVVVVLVSMINIMAPDTVDRVVQRFVPAEVDSTLIAEQAPIPDDLIEDGVHVATGLKFDDGFNQVKASCLACHSSKLITQNRATRDGWKKMIRWMQETQNLWDLGPNEDIILDYLAKNYAPEETGRRAQLTDIEWYVLED